MTKIKIALCQMNVIDNKEENLKKASSMINKACNNADFIVLPEMFKPLGKNSVYVVSHELSCKPCQKRCCPLGTTKCLYDISENEIISTVCKMMKI